MNDGTLRKEHSIREESRLQSTGVVVGNRKSKTTTTAVVHGLLASLPKDRSI